MKHFCTYHANEKKCKSLIKKIFFYSGFFLLLIFLIYVDVNAGEIYVVEGVSGGSNTEPISLKLYAKAAVLIDATNNRVLYEKNGNEIMPMASTTKIMTAIIALENGNVDDVVTVSKKATGMPKVKLGMREGEQYYLKDLLYSLMLESHNDTAVAIAEHIGGSVEGFAEMMNQKARDLGCYDTFFITPNGLDASIDDKEHSTTATDLAKIAAYAIKNEEFCNLIATRNASFCEIGSGRSYSVANKDRFLDMMDGAIGIKTGFTNKAGYCFVGAVEQEGKKLVSVVLASGWPPNKNYKWADTKELMKYGLDHYQMTELKQPEISNEISVVNGVEDSVGICIDQDAICMLLSDWDQVDISCEMKEQLKAPVAANEVIGYEKIRVNGQLYQTFPITVKESVGEYTFLYCLTRVVDVLFL